MGSSQLKTLPQLHLPHRNVPFLCGVLLISSCLSANPLRSELLQPIEAYANLYRRL